jgi:copper(I)-binding protein
MMARITSRFSRAAGRDGDVALTNRIREFLRRSVSGVAAVTMVLALSNSLTALAAESGVSLQGGWMRTLIPSRPAAGYFVLQNTTGTAKTLIGASSSACGQLMLHESLHQGGQERMAMVKQIGVPAHGTLSFTPGDYHLMCMQPGATMKPGGTVRVTLRFADGGTLVTDFAVRGAGGQ